jgi:hypothetical protein
MPINTCKSITYKKPTQLTDMKIPLSQKSSLIFRTTLCFFTSIVLVNISAHTQEVYTSKTTQTVKPVVMNFMERVAEYNANPPVVLIEYKTPKVPTDFPENPIPIGISANVYTGKPKISGVAKLPQGQVISPDAASPAPSTEFTAIIDNIQTIPPRCSWCRGAKSCYDNLE